MSRVRADRLTDRASTGAPTFPNGAVITGVATATTFSGNATSATSATNALGLTGTPDITVRNVTGVAATFTGVLTYEDVTSIDSIGVVTARSGVDLNGNLRESVNIVASKLSDAPNINLANGMVHYFTTTESTTSTPNIMSTVGINTTLNTGDTISVNIFTSAAAGGYSARVSIDGVLTGITTYWSGGSAPSAGGSSGKDVYTYQIVKTASATYDVLASLSNFA